MRLSISRDCGLRGECAGEGGVAGFFLLEKGTDVAGALAALGAYLQLGAQFAHRGRAVFNAGANLAIGYCVTDADVHEIEIYMKRIVL